MLKFYTLRLVIDTDKDVIEFIEEEQFETDRNTVEDIGSEELYDMTDFEYMVDSDIVGKA